MEFLLPVKVSSIRSGRFRKCGCSHFSSSLSDPRLLRFSDALSSSHDGRNPHPSQSPVRLCQVLLSSVFSPYFRLNCRLGNTVFRTILSSLSNTKGTA